MSWGGVRASFPVHLTPPHAIHGTLLERSWSVAEHGPGHARLEAELGEPWPFEGLVAHDITLYDDRLECRLELRSTGKTFPAIVGWHPWFAWTLRDRDGAVHGDRAQVHIPAGGMLRRGPGGLPDGSVERPMPDGPWDDCFVDLSGTPSVMWPGALRIAVESDAAYAVVLTERPEGLCIEPQTGPPNGLNDGVYTLVAPGTPLTASMRLRWEAM